MCSVTLWPRTRGFLLGMNRDERRDRVTGLPPVLEKSEDVWVISPLEPTGGTWISLNDHGVGFALVNWYAQPFVAQAPIRSRGDLIRNLRHYSSPDSARRSLSDIVLNHLHPFRLVGIFPALQQVVEWRWSGTGLQEDSHDWAARQWLSSGWDEPGAQRSRSAVFERLRNEAGAGTVGWMRNLHASHEPEPGPYSTCMHRPDAATVSYTELEVDGSRGELRHHDGPLCETRSWVAEALSLRP